MFLFLHVSFLPDASGIIYSKRGTPLNQIYDPQYHPEISDFGRWSVAKENLVLLRKRKTERQYDSSHGLEAAGISFLDSSNGQW